MARLENAQIEEPAEKVVPIAESEAETVSSPGSVTKRPFVLDKTRGSGGGNMPLMLMALGAIIIFGIGIPFATRAACIAESMFEATPTFTYSDNAFACSRMLCAI